MTRTAAIRISFILASCLAGAGSAFAASNQKAAEPSCVAADAVIEYCMNITDKAKELRAARQAAMLKELEERVDAKIKELDAKRAELQTWVEQQQALRTAAEQAVVDIYATMEAEVAAKQLTELDPRTASSVLRQMKPRQASAILNEMKPEQAAPLMRIIAAASEKPKP